jgi:hypothetical protein
MEQDNQIIIEINLVLFRYSGRRLQVLTVEKGTLPGGIISISESGEDAALRICKESGILDNDVHVEQLHTFTEVNRVQPRAIAIVYICIVKEGDLGQIDSRARWNNVSYISELKADQLEMFNMAVEKLKKRLLYSTIAQYLLPSSFTLTQLENMYEDILEVGIDKRNFRKKILKLKIVTPTGDIVGGLKHRPASLYKFVGFGISNEKML